MAKPKRVNPTKFFESVTENAFDFLETAACQLEKSPKQSLINFAAAVELFLKARLMIEHWSLIFDKPQSAEVEAFLKGDFRSVTLAEAIQRLKNIASEVISSHEQNAFKEIARHRNKLVHFFHADYAKPKKSAVEQVLLEQIQAWFYLHRLLIQHWGRYFLRFEKRIKRIDKLIKNNRKYLAGKFRALIPEIDKLKKKGVEFVTCNKCGYASASVDEINEPLFTRKCLVCEASMNLLRTECPGCKGVIEIEDLGEGTCDCGHEITIENLLDTYGPHEDPKEEPEVLYCAYCERADEQTAIPFGDGYLCLSCLELSLFSGQCEWCDTRFAGFDDDDSYLTGCAFCEGKIGWDTD